MNNQIEISIVLPCLNEADTLLICINKIKETIVKNNLSAEIIIADNGSNDGSKDIAINAGVRVIEVKEKGYGSALMGGIEAAKGKYIIMGDADNSYDFYDIMKFIDKLNDGYDMVMGCRLPKGGGVIKKSAMPFLHRYIGNPFFSILAKIMFKAPNNDPNCGFRAFTKNLYHELNMKCKGMEFAVELILKSVLFNKKIGEVPITLYPDGRKAHPPHLRTFRDGWRTLRFYILLSPAKLFFIPGTILTSSASILIFFAYFKQTSASLSSTLNLLLLTTLFFLSGIQIIIFGFFAKTFAAVEGITPKLKSIFGLYDFVTIEKGMLISFIFFIIGISFFIHEITSFHNSDVIFNNNFQHLKTSVASFSFIMLSIQIFFSNLLFSSIGLNRR